MSKSKVRAI